MSQHDLVAELRAARPVAPAEVRERVRLIAAAATDATTPRRIFTRRNALVVLLPAAAALAAAVVLARPASHEQESTALKRVVTQHAAALPQQRAVSHGAAVGRPASPKRFAPAPSPTRLQRYGAFLSLRLASASRVSDGVKQALRIVAGDGGFAVSVHASSQGRYAAADLVVKVPRTHVQRVVAQIAQLGTIASEQVEVQDLQAGVNATDRTIARLQTQLRDLRARPKSLARDRGIASLTATVQRLQRSEAETQRTASLATVRLHLQTAAAKPKPVPHKHHHGPLRGIAVGAYWTGIGALYALAAGVPLLLLALLVWLGVRVVRRRRVDALLSRP